jgi:hypothetical protein
MRILSWVDLSLDIQLRFSGTGSLKLFIRICSGWVDDPVFLPKWKRSGFLGGGGGLRNSLSMSIGKVSASVVGFDAQIFLLSLPFNVGAANKEFVGRGAINDDIRSREASFWIASGDRNS